MTVRKLHFISGVIISAFVALHLFNHMFALAGASWHIITMNTLRPVYRNAVVELTLLVAVTIQICSGLRLFWITKNSSASFFETIQRWSGLYLSIFFVIHLAAVLAGRFLLHLDTNFYFGVAGLNTFPLNLFFIPYYGLAIIAFFGHIASIHHEKTRLNFMGVSRSTQAKVIFTIGIIVMLLIMVGLTNQFRGVDIPKEYEVLIGK